jgi:hypothetical protein
MLGAVPVKLVGVVRKVELSFVDAVDVAKCDVGSKVELVDLADVAEVDVAEVVVDGTVDTVVILLPEVGVDVLVDCKDEETLVEVTVEDADDKVDDVDGTIVVVVGVVFVVELDVNELFKVVEGVEVVVDEID